MADRIYTVDVDANDSVAAEVLSVVKQVKPLGLKGILRSDSNLVATYGDKVYRGNAGVPALPVLDMILPDGWEDVALENLDGEDRLRPWLLAVKGHKAALSSNKGNNKAASK